MPTILDLEHAVENAQLAEIQNLLQERDERGIPLIDINNTRYATIFHHVCFIASREYGPRLPQALIRSMFEYLLNLRDLDGNPIANPNVMHRNSGNLLTALVDLNDVYLLQLVLDLRTNRGEMVADVYAGVQPGHFWSPLRRALFMNRIDMVRALVDARNVDGTRLLTLEQIRDDLTGATSHQFGGGSYVNNNESIHFLNGFLAGVPVQNIMVGGQLRQAHIAQENIFINHFNANKQNTHDPSVTQTAKGSLLSLNKTYANQLNEVICINEIEQLIRKFDYTKVMSALTVANKKTAVRNFLTLLTSRFDVTHSYTGFTIKKILALVWLGVKDNNISVFPEEIRRTFKPNIALAPSEIVNQKQASFIEKFIEAALEYKDRGMTMDICIGGSVHKLLESLNFAHIDVVITTGTQQVKPAANDMALAIVGLELRKKSTKEQALILSDWDEDEFPVTMEFKASVVDTVTDGLKNHFGTLLTEGARGEIVGFLPDMPRPPAPHRELNELVTEIVNRVQLSGSILRKQNVQALHKFAREIYFESSSDHEKHKKLDSEYRAFLELDEIMEKIHAEPEDDNDTNHQNYLKNLKSKVESIYSDQSLFFARKKHKIHLEYQLFKETVDYLAKAKALFLRFEEYFAQLEELITSNPGHQKDLNQFSVAVKQSIEAFQLSIKQDDNNIKELIDQFNRNFQNHIKIVSNALQKEPGVWRNLNPIIKSMLGVLAALAVIPAVFVQTLSCHGFMGTFFTLPETEITKKFKEKKLFVLPCADHYKERVQSKESPSSSPHGFFASTSAAQAAPPEPSMGTESP